VSPQEVRHFIIDDVHGTPVAKVVVLFSVGPEQTILEEKKLCQDL
jgi:hypothetical protein